MNRTCPHFRGAKVRRSSTHVNEISWRNKVLSRYRCLECNLQFWVISRRSYILMASLVCALLLAGLGVFVLDLMFNRPLPSDGVPQARMRPPAETRPVARAHMAASPAGFSALRQT